MADDSFLSPSTSTLIAGRFAVDPAQAMLDAGGGLPAYLARDRMAADGRRVALSVSRDASPRLRHLRLLNELVDNLMVPLGHGVAPLQPGKGVGYFVICTQAPGPPISAALNPWPEKVLFDLVLRPAARVLEYLQGRRLTHRAIRPNNVFQAAPGQPITLGAAWAAPPAMHQPAVFESPYSAMCLPSGRGDGTTADDVYALGVLLLTLAAGRLPMPNLDAAAVVRMKLDLGSFAALTRDMPVSGSLADLLRGMLAEDPEHRPPPGLLLDIASTRGRRLAARPARRSQTALALNDVSVFDARSLAYALFNDEKKAIQFLRNGLVTQWLRRALGDAGLATQIEDLVRSRLADTKSGQRGDPLLVMQTVSALNPRMPMCWRGVALFPDALPAVLAEGIASKSGLLATVEELLVNDIAGVWAATETRPASSEYADLTQQRYLLQGGGPSGLLRLFYGTNPVLPCRVSAMGTAWIMSMADLMGYFESSAGSTGDALIDLHVAAFIAARADRKIEGMVNTLVGSKDAGTFRLAELLLLQELQARYRPVAMPGLAQWVVIRLQPDLERWRNKPRREAMQARLETLAQGGFLARLLELTGDTTALALDIAGAYRAANEVARIDAEVAAIDRNDKARFANAERFGQVIAGGIGLSALILMVMSVLLR